MVKCNIRKRKKHSEEARRKISESMKGHSVSEETCMKMSKSHLGQNQGEKHYRWKGGIIKSGNGYIWILKPDHPNAMKSGYIQEHRLVMENHLGRYLLPTEVVHHINEVRYDNRIENLMLFGSNKEHRKFHMDLSLNQREEVYELV